MSYGIGWDGYTTTAVTPRALLQSDANNENGVIVGNDDGNDNSIDDNGDDDYDEGEYEKEKNNNNDGQCTMPYMQLDNAEYAAQYRQ